MEYVEVYLEALETFGLDSQIKQTVEECAELINALCKFQRGRCSFPEVVTEIADVIIMAHQMALSFGVEAVEKEIQYKVKRLHGRIQNLKQKQTEL